MAEQKHLDFEVHLEPGAPDRITTDPQRLQQILKNLLSNGFKFTEQGRVELRIGRAPQGMRFVQEALKDADTVVAFTVSDTGIGIPEDKQQLIFEAFQQADASTSRMYGGTGLGLTISRELAQLLGGEISVKSAAGAGSTFTLYLPSTLPLSEISARDHGTDRPRLKWQRDPDLETTIDLKDLDLGGRTVVAIDDDARNLFAITSLLERAGVRVVAASSASEGLEALERLPQVDAVLMDIMLPGMDGYEATRRIRAVERHRALPVIALTAKAMPGDREKCLEAGCTDFVPKPVDSGRLLSVLGKLFPQPSVRASN